MTANIPKGSLQNFVIFTGVLLVVIGVLVVPSYFAIGKAEADRVKIKTEVDEQRQLAPIFKELVKKRNELKAHNANLPVRAALARDDAGGIADQLTRLAVDSRMQMVGISPDLNAMVNEDRLMRVDMVLRGRLADCRAFLDQLVAVPHIEFIEKIRITAIPAGREYRMRIWAALK